MKRIFSLILPILILFSGITHTVQEIEKPVIAFDCDEVISTSPVSRWAKIAFILAKIPFTNPRLTVNVALHPWETFNVVKEEIKKDTGVANIINGVAAQLKAKQYGDVGNLKDKMLDAYISPIPCLPVLALMQQLHEKGYTVVTATNQEVEHHKIYIDKIKQQSGYDLNEIANKTVAYKYAQQASADGFNQENKNYGIENCKKPAVNYFETLKKITGSSTIFFFDDKMENIEGARQADIKAEQFDNRKHSVEKVTTFLKAHGVTL